jgi:DNA ligase 1
MERFTRLYMDLDACNRTTDKLTALRKYFREAPPADAAWALYFLTGRRTPRAISSPIIRQWAAEESAFPLWLLEDCYEVVGDLAETIALLLPSAGTGTTKPLHELVETCLLPMKAMPEGDRRALLISCWKEMTAEQRFIWNKLLMGSFRVGVAQTLVIRALAEVAAVETPTMAHRLMGTWEPTAAAFQSLMDQIGVDADPAKPYPFFLAYPIDGLPADLGEAAGFQAEWKWDGIRAQVIRRCNQVLIWSRGEELVTDRFPEIEIVGQNLPDGTVLDGEIVAWVGDRPAPFQALQRRITRKQLTPRILREVPAMLIAYDVLEWNGQDVRSESLNRRRELLESLTAAMPPELPFRISTVHAADNWDTLASIREQSRENCAEGLMLKRLDSPYRTGRVKGDWWKWKVQPFTIDAVLTYAQPGHGKRAGLYTDYTFGVWHNGELLTIAKAYSGLTDKEIGEVDAWVRKHTLEKFGPVRSVKPELVFELAFEGIQTNPRNKSKVAVRFPRMLRWRRDKRVSEADSLETIQALLAAQDNARMPAED